MNTKLLTLIFYTILLFLYTQNTHNIFTTIAYEMIRVASPQPPSPPRPLETLISTPIEVLGHFWCYSRDFEALKPYEEEEDHWWCVC
uniref:Uncharacterized protein n=1 Tax=Lactuca sativa TaxID=4236 RepID=A0A9R1WDN0_LACSA|nr:hypothetical protein LSAT_V11C200079290 [Lactuca sativa]